MCEDLGFEKLLSEEGFFARLFARSPSGAGRDPLYGPDLPVVLLTGGPGMGKGRLLRAVRDRFATKVPVIHLDCGSPVYAGRAAPEPDARSDATEVLVEVARRLCTWQGTGGSFAFPRLFTGLAMIATGVTAGTPAAVAAEVERYEELPQRQRLPGLGAGGFWRGVLRGTIRNLLTTLSGQVLGPYPAAVSNALLDGLFESLAPRGRAELERIYGAYPGAAGQPQHGLRNLAADFQAGGEARELAESFLFRALREDLEAAYASASGWLRRVGRPGLLLDHAESPLGERLLRAVLTDRRGGQRDRVVVVGTARRADGGAFLYGGLPPREVPVAEFRPADGGPPAWSRRTGSGADQAPPADGVLLLRMPLLTGDQLRRETERRQRRAEPEGGTNRRRIDSAVARLSGGRPHTVIRLAAAAAAFRMPADANDRDILDAPLRLPGDGAPERPVAEVLLRELVLDQLPVRLPDVHRDQWLDLLTHLSVAHDEECADVLLRHHQAGRVHHLTAHHVSQLLIDTGWPSCERHFIGDFGLRQLLVHRLYGLRPGGAAWYADHHLLRDHYAERAQADEDVPGGGAFRSLTAHRMNHHLVSGGADDVVGHLAATLPGRPREWCAELLEIAQAPYPGGADARRERAQGLVAADGPALRRTVDQLLHAVWLCEERTRPTGKEMADTLATLLGRLSIMEFAGAGQLGRTATEWSGLAENERPLLRCTCTEQLGRRR
ncbi:hypothetical protein [Streptomyces sp. NL15-2K]|uniref:hypothetical protein n=1 Tax=Streptomyces sp. NL15-2K TaxID=376149 RepID=UPI000F589EAE|nr:MULTISPECIES: hypothetical protein [Actinomycetes]WKX10586.1 hypothetical protein Q4V64_25035 [Kutzneria buriramensis]GCB47873.1 hypothetical protein SNL152K_5186 [Streptomyces sp. NL15-2K]